MPKQRTTPMIRQYLSIKEQYSDAILFYRMGDFYEMFFEDANVASGILEIALTSRNKKEANPIPMCGVPYRAAQSYIAKLIEAGHKVAVCDQVEDPSKAKGLVKRDVVRVITPGMVIENELLDAKDNNFVLAVAVKNDQIGVAGLDISTGDFRVTEGTSPAKMVVEAQKMAPKEILLPERANDDPAYEPFIAAVSGIPFSYLDPRWFGVAEGRRRLLEILGTLNLEGFGCEHLQAGLAAAGAILAYVKETQKRAISHIQRIDYFTDHQFMQLDESSYRNLEIVQNIRNGSRQGTLISVVDRCVTAMGARKLKHWLRYPLTDMAAIEQRLDAVTAVVDNYGIVDDLKKTLKQVSDLERLGSKIAMGHASARDLLALKRSLQALPEIKAQTAALEAGLFAWQTPLTALNRLAGEIDAAIRDDAPLTIQEGGLFKTGYHAELDELISISRDGKKWLARLERQEREKTGINSLKVKYNKVFGYYIEVSKTNLTAVPEHYIRKQTLVNAERYITEDLKAFEVKVFSAEEKRAGLELALFTALREEVMAVKESIFAAARHTARIDSLINLAEIAVINDYHRPRLNREGLLRLEESRHPVVEKLIAGERFVPNNVFMDNKSQQVLMITGPNMAGKSTVLRQTALIVIMAQMGSFVPAAKADIAITDRIFTRVGALDNLASGQSTFLVEMQETANILNNATCDSLVIMDEIGRGTSTFDGMSIAWAVAEYLHDYQGKGVKTLFATHYHELTALAAKKERIANLNIAVKEWNDEIIFLRKLVQGGANRSYGIQVARLAGVPAAVIHQAKVLLNEMENGRFGQKYLQTDSGLVTPTAELKAAQMSLFRSEEAALLAEIKELNVDQMTPIEALTLLNELIEKARTLTSDS